jgi:hypothetical protein
MAAEVAEPGSAEFYVSASAQEIKEAIKEGVSTLAQFNSEYGNPDPIQVSLYRLYARGAEASEEKRFVLRRRRTIPVEFAAPATVRAVELVYTTPKLITEFDVPASVIPLLPPDPGFQPADTLWGWRERANTSDFQPSINKVEEVMEWVFAAWSTILYEPA